MTTLQLVSLYSMAAIYIIAGVCHFITPKFYLKITPKWVPFPEYVNVLVGVIEIVLGLAVLFTFTRQYAAIGIIALLVAVFPANVYHFKKAKRKQKQVLITFLRLPIQALLIYWAYTFV
jgi:uncharacterized membrane protein